MRPLQANIDSQALIHNFKRVKAYSSRSKVMSVLKANAYGHGLIEVARALNQSDGFSVLTLTEAIELREFGFNQQILMLEGFFEGYEVSIAAQLNIGVTLHNQAQLNLILDEKPKKPIDIHLKVNTGMNRLGFLPEDVPGILKVINASPFIGKIILMTHFANADEAVGIASQMKAFSGIKYQQLERSVANSAALIRYPESRLEWVRPGIMLYGASPFEGTTAKDLDLVPVMSLRSKIIAIQSIKKGESVGYGSSFFAKTPMKIGIVACGYADGYPRHAVTGTPVTVNNVMTSTVGRVSMDMLYVDITKLKSASIGSDVELWGKNVPVDSVAEKSGTVGYELLCSISSTKRVPLRYLDG
jgi:alanine racemase